MIPMHPTVVANWDSRLDLHPSDFPPPPPPFVGTHSLAHHVSAPDGSSSSPAPRAREVPLSEALRLASDAQARKESTRRAPETTWHVLFFPPPFFSSLFFCLFFFFRVPLTVFVVLEGNRKDEPPILGAPLVSDPPCFVFLFSMFFFKRATFWSGGKQSRSRFGGLP